MRESGSNHPFRRQFVQGSGGIALAAALDGYLGEFAVAVGRTTPSDRVTRLVDEMTLEEKVG